MSAPARVLTHPTAETVRVPVKTLIEISDQAKAGEALTRLASHVHDLVSLTRAVLQDARRGVVSQHASDDFELMAHRMAHQAAEEINQLREDTAHIHFTALELVVAEQEVAQ